MNLRRLRPSIALVFLLGTFGFSHAQDAVVDAVARLRTAVVSIAVTSASPQPAAPGDADPNGAVPAVAPTPAGKTVGAGTLISADGLILTVVSLLEPAGDITVLLDNGQSRPASVVGRDRHTGLALLKMQGQQLPHVPLGPPSGLALGERVILLGRTTFEAAAPPVVTEGLVSAVFNASQGAAPFIQTTAQVLPGMGGGPLIRVKTGELVGIASHQYLPKSGAPLTFAVPIEEYLRIAEELRSKGRVDRAAIGITADVLPEELARSIGLPAGNRVFLAAVRRGGPAHEAGLERGDVVLSVDGQPPASAVALYELIRRKPVGSTFELRVLRKGMTKVVGVTSESASR